MESEHSLNQSGNFFAMENKSAKSASLVILSGGLGNQLFQLFTAIGSIESGTLIVNISFIKEKGIIEELVVQLNRELAYRSELNVIVENH